VPCAVRRQRTAAGIQAPRGSPTPAKNPGRTRPRGNGPDPVEVPKRVFRPPKQLDNDPNGRRRGDPHRRARGRTPPCAWTPWPRRPVTMASRSNKTESQASTGHREGATLGAVDQLRPASGGRCPQGTRFSSNMASVRRWFRRSRRRLSAAHAPIADRLSGRLIVVAARCGWRPWAASSRRPVRVRREQIRHRRPRCAGFHDPGPDRAIDRR
jgi:hypothetical protein